MAISKYKIKKWIKMISGKSILHVNQGIGKLYSKEEIKGYYNDLTEKVTRDSITLEGELPKYPGEDGVNKIFPIGVFQYGLGAYDLFLMTGDVNYLNKFKLCAEWTAKNQDENGGWKTFEYETPKTPYSAMAQGEAISLLSRYYIETADEECLKKIKHGIKFLMMSQEEGGVSFYNNNDIYLKEFVDRPVVLNGWIFAIFGIKDYLLLFPDDMKVSKFYNSTIKTLISALPKYDLGYWSKYDIDKRISSPFYHNLHIAQLDALYNLTKEDIFRNYKIKFLKYSNKKAYKLKAFLIKTYQKVME